MTTRGLSAELWPMGGAGRVRHAQSEDCEAIAQIYSEGIAERRSTFETELRSAADIKEWFDSEYPLLVAKRDGVVVGWARIAPYSQRTCYAGIGEGSIYVCTTERGLGLGSALATALIDEAEEAGLYKLVGKLFVDNDASRRLVARHGFREVGVHLRHGRTEGKWRDVLVVELLLGEARGLPAPNADLDSI